MRSVPLHRWLAALALLVCVAICAPGSIAAPAFPPLTGRVVDQANMLDPAVEASLSARLEALEQKTSRQLVVVTVSSLQGLEIEDYGYQLGRAWGIGEAKKDTGVLFLVAPNERRVRIEVGYGLEDVLTDALSNVILQEKVLPKFRDGDMTGGVIAGADALIEQLALPADEATSRVQAAANADTRSADEFPLIIVALLVIWIVFGLIGSMGSRPGRRINAWLWPLIFLSRGGGGFGGGSGGGFSGGGFSGGGGSFGGGGASGKW
jgi:uncharacterized protein